MTNKSDNRELMRKKDLVERSDIPKTTLTDWINEFSPFVPIVPQGRTKYYTETSLEVLERIRDLRAEGYDKLQIAEILTKEYPINVDEVERKAEVHRKQGDSRDAVYLAMQAVGELSNRLDEMNEKQEQMREKYTELKERIEKQDEYIKESLDERDRKLTEHMRNVIEERNRKNYLKRFRESVVGLFKSE